MPLSAFAVPDTLLEDLVGPALLVSSEGRIHGATPAAARLLGRSDTTLLGTSLFDLMVPSTALAGLREMMASALEGGRATGRGAIRHPDETAIDVLIDCLAVPRAGPSDLLLQLRDISRFVESEAVPLERRFRSLLEAAPDAMIIVDRDGCILLVNAQTERMFGYPRDELLGGHVERLVPGRFHGVHPGHRRTYHDAPRPRPMGTGLELSGLHKDGHEFPVEISLSPLETETTEGRLVIAAIRDVTDQKEQYRRAQEASRLKSEFLANMSHELRTPLNAVIGFAEIIHDGRAGPVLDEQREYLGDILTSSRHLLQIINDVLDLAKVEAGRLALAPEPVRVDAVVGEVRDMLRTLAATKRMQVDVDLDPSLGELHLDPSRLRQVLYNYLSNALKFTPDGGRVVIRTRAEGDQRFRLEVEDDGIGIAPADLSRLFVEFQQLDASAAKRFAGTGLGLALTRQIVEAQGGEVGVTSTVGRGSTFFAVLPRAMIDEPAIPDTREPSP